MVSYMSEGEMELLKVKWRSLNETSSLKDRTKLHLYIPKRKSSLRNTIKLNFDEFEQAISHLSNDALGLNQDNKHNK